MKLLIADDQESIHTYLSKMVSWETMGISNLIHAYDGEECLHKLQAEGPTLILLDIRMPRMDGLQVLGEIKRRNIKFVKVIILSAYDDFAYARAAIRYGVEDYLLKPIDRKELEVSIQSCIRRLKDEIGYALREYLLHEDTAEFWHSFPLRSMEIVGALVEAEKGIDSVPYDGGMYWSFQVSPSCRFLLTNSPDGIEALNHLPPDARVACSQPCFAQSPQMVMQCFEQCQDTLARSRFYQQGSVSTYREIAPLPDIHELDFYIDRLVNGVLARNTDALQSAVGLLFAQLKAWQLEPSQGAKLCTSLLSKVSFLVSKENVYIDYIDIGGDLYQCMRQCDTLAQMEIAFTEKLHNDSLADGNASSSLNLEVNEISAYLEQNLGRTLTLDIIAKHFTTNKYDLCRRFKQCTGKTLWNCLTDLRIEQAKQLLSDTTMKIYEVSEATGFNSSTYFSNTFKKATGVRPQQWKRP